MEDRKKEMDVLVDFINIPINSDEQVFEKFNLPNAIMRKGKRKFEQFVYIRGSRQNKVLLVAHADTVWDKKWEKYSNARSEYEIDGNVIKSVSHHFGIGADDRAGCAMLWLLKDMGHSLLITTGEEKGQLGSHWIMEAPENNDIRDEIQNNHQFVVQLDRQNGNEFKCYTVGTDDFRNYVSEKTGYTEPDRDRRTDIVVLCDKITGVNLSIGYYNEHHPNEYINIKEWHNTYQMLKNWISDDNLPRFER